MLTHNTRHFEMSLSVAQALEKLKLPSTLNA